MKCLERILRTFYVCFGKNGVSHKKANHYIKYISTAENPFVRKKRYLDQCQVMFSTFWEDFAMCHSRRAVHDVRNSKLQVWYRANSYHCQNNNKLGLHAWIINFSRDQYLLSSLEKDLLYDYFYLFHIYKNFEINVFSLV